MVSATPRDHGSQHILHVLRARKVFWVSDLREWPKPIHGQLCSAEERDDKVGPTHHPRLIALSNTASLCPSHSTRYFTAQNGKELKWKIADGRMEVRVFLTRRLRLSEVSNGRVLTLSSLCAVLQWACRHCYLRTCYVP